MYSWIRFRDISLIKILEVGCHFSIGYKSKDKWKITLNSIYLMSGDEYRNMYDCEV